MQARSIPGGSGATYFNPALLTDTPQGMKVGFYMLNQRIGMQIDGRPGTQFSVPEAASTFTHAGGARFDNYPIGTNLLQFGRLKTAAKPAFDARPRQGAPSGHDLMTYETVGFVVKLFSERLTVGFHGMIPNGQFTRMRAFFNDEREQYFSNSLHPELYSDRMTALSLAVGFGLKLTDMLSIGVGTTFALKAGVGAGAYVADAGNLGNIQLDMDSGVNMGVSPHFGVSFKPSSRLTFTATGHTPQRVELEAKFKFLLSTANEQQSGLKFVLDYTPWQVGAGAAYDLIQEPDRTLTLAGSALYAGWSSYVDRHGETPKGAYAWADTISPSAGVRYRLGDFTGSVDLQYVPTPVPEQTGRTNYVDTDRVSGGLGAEFRFMLFGSEMRLGGQLHIHRLVPRYQAKLATPTRPDGANVAPERVKDEIPDDAQKSGEPVEGAQGLQTNNPGWPGFSSGGWVMGGAMYLSVAF